MSTRPQQSRTRGTARKAVATGERDGHHPARAHASSSAPCAGTGHPRPQGRARPAQGEGGPLREGAGTPTRGVGWSHNPSRGRHPPLGVNHPPGVRGPPGDGHSTPTGRNAISTRHLLSSAATQTRRTGLLRRPQAASRARTSSKATHTPSSVLWALTTPADTQARSVPAERRPPSRTGTSRSRSHLSP